MSVLVEGQAYASARVDFTVGRGESYTYVFALYQSGGSGGACATPVLGGPQEVDADATVRCIVGRDGEPNGIFAPVASFVTRGSTMDPAEVQVRFDGAAFLTAFSAGDAELWWRLVLTDDGETYDRIRGRIALREPDE